LPPPILSVLYICICVIFVIIRQCRECSRFTPFCYYYYVFSPRTLHNTMYTERRRANAIIAIFCVFLFSPLALSVLKKIPRGVHIIRYTVTRRMQCIYIILSKRKYIEEIIILIVIHFRCKRWHLPFPVHPKSNGCYT